ncbi:MobF family relaxase [Bradyrhizobium sp. CB2312]|uniref:MobF family relaxase n=1 Tax=Bradyrhizobium sp. CB2312 TaxID=3039155 RepID=UPI0024B27646|nr:MobF family relaxase [Bradyrhizobium sp. CB2312]WFU72911.1 MobF family relaxase [Bradyrhizobium sp. CB2312]
MTASLHTLGAGRDAGLYYVNDPNREARPRSRDEYYIRDGGGLWWTTGETIVRHGAAIDKESFRDLCAGIDPRTGERLVRGAGPKHRAGWDITFSAPKSLSILWMAGDEQQRVTLHALHRAAVEDALRFLVDERLVEVRLGAGGYLREPAADVIVGRFDHYTSREGDCAIHTHAVLLNTAGSGEKYRTLEPEKLFEHQLVLGAAFRASLAHRLAAIGFPLREAGRNQFEIAGIPQSVIETFSKRSRQIEELVGRDATGAQKELAALATRGSKDEVPVGEILEARWKEELAQTGTDPWEAVRNYVPGQEVELAPERDLDPPEIEGSGPVAVAASKLFRHQSVITRRDLVHGALIEAAIRAVSIDQVWAELRSYEECGIVRKLTGERQAEYWTTQAIAAAEASLLRSADRLNEQDWFQQEALEAALANAPYLSQEQADAIRFAANRDGVTICEAPAGTGKTVMTQALVEAAQRSGLKILGLTPTWVAADELSKSCGIEACAIAKWRYDHERKIGSEIDANTLIIIDETGLAGVRDLETVLSAAHEAHTKVVCLGDRRQLQAVPGGSALKAISDVIGRGAVLSQVRRQTVEWQRAASIVMARGDSDAGLRAYAQHRKLEVVPGEAKAQARVIEMWNTYRHVHGDDVLIVTRRNSDAAALNRAARAVLRSEGRLLSEDLSLPAVGRDKKIGTIELAQGDLIRFSENLPRFSIRNGTRGTIERLTQDDADVKIAVRLDDGRIIETEWGCLARERAEGPPRPPRISLAYAGTAYSVQGRTSAAAVLYVAKPTDAREIYVGLTRHKIDAYVVAERNRLEAAVAKRQLDPRLVPGEAAIRERLFSEATSYAEKVNVVDFADDRIEFARTGQLQMRCEPGSLNVGRVARAARRMVEASREMSAETSLTIAAWRLVDSARHIRQDIAQRFRQITQAIKDRINFRAKERRVARELGRGR